METPVATPLVWWWTLPGCPQRKNWLWQKTLVYQKRLLCQLRQ
jgi:hypothetical protein